MRRGGPRTGRGMAPLCRLCPSTQEALPAATAALVMLVLLAPLASVRGRWACRRCMAAAQMICILGAASHNLRHRLAARHFICAPVHFMHIMSCTPSYWSYRRMFASCRHTCGQTHSAQQLAPMPAFADEPVLMEPVDTSAARGAQAGTAARPVCAVRGCGAPLAGLRDFHQRYRICDAHIKVRSCGTVVLSACSALKCVVMRFACLSQCGLEQHWSCCSQYGTESDATVAI